jgi:maleylacetoacetate isomerase
MIALYDYHRSSAAYRVRIALNLKGLSYEPRAVDLLRGEQLEPGYCEVNPQGRVPTLVDQQRRLGQSLAIIEYLDETCPDPPLLPPTAPERARVRQLAQIVACEIHPLNNLRVLQHLEQDLRVDEETKRQWYQRWIAEGFAAFESLLADDRTGRYCHGDAPTLADCCLVPQVYNARRWDCDLSPYPAIRRIEAGCLALPAFDRARPEAQPHAPR